MLSDRQKGLSAALASVFPKCALHIQRNVFQRFGLNAATHNCTIAKTYTVIQEENLFQSIKKEEAVDNLKTVIRPNQWRSAEWVDMSLPPRYGMTTSNISESANSMIDMGRRGTWLDCMHELISIMVLKIVKLRRTAVSNENK